MSQYYPPWRNENSLRRYPFEDTATLVSEDESLILPDDWLVDAAIFVRGAVLPMRISKIAVLNDLATIVISDAESTDFGEVTLLRGSGDNLKLVDSSGDWVGTLVCGDNLHYPIFEAGDGTFYFREGTTEFVSSVVLNLPANRGLLSFSNIYGKSGGQGDVYFVGESGVQLETVQTDEYRQDGTILPVTLIRIHVMGDPQHAHVNCTESTRRTSRPIRELVFQYGTQTHSCFPDADGNVIIIAGTAASSESALYVNPSPYGLTVNLPGKRI